MRPLPAVIFMSRWLQVPLYLGLIVAQGVYVVLFLKEVWHLVTASMTLDETNIMLVVLGLIDVVMISNLLIMVIIGGYETFVSRLGVEGHPDEPEWLDHVNAGTHPTHFQEPADLQPLGSAGSSPLKAHD
ncbi:MAG: YqhA family protein [Burkholderia sp.]|nr:YqhA family protein [Burkholderia sp.]